MDAFLDVIGTLPDREIARRADVTVENVRSFRKRRGILAGWAPEQAAPRGFAAMTSEKRAQIASMGGRAVQASGSAYRFTPEKARLAGQTGGREAHARGHAHRFTSAEASLAGQRGGRKRWDRVRAAAAAQTPDRTPSES